MNEFNPSAIVALLARHEVSCVLIRGYAALLKGSGRTTIDVDIVPARANLAKPAIYSDL